MEIKIAVTVDLSTQTIEVLKQLLNSSKNEDTKAAEPVEVKSLKEKPESTKIKVEKPKVEIAETVEEKEEPKQFNGDITLEQLRAAGAEKSKEGKAEKVKSLLAEYDAKSISTVAPENYIEFYSKLTAL